MAVQQCDFENKWYKEVFLSTFLCCFQCVLCLLAGTHFLLEYRNCLHSSDVQREYATIFSFSERGDSVEKRIAILGIIIEDAEQAMPVNDLLHEYRDCIIGRMGMPYREKNISVISVVLDAPNEVISALSGKLGMLSGVSSKAVYSKK